MLLDHAASSHVAIETIDIDTMILQKQITPPDRGYYLSGLHLVNASWDSMRNVLKDISTNTATFELTCLWIQPLVKHDMESVGGKQVGTSIKRNWQKYQIPWFQFIGSGSDEEFVTGEFEYGSLYITCLEMTSDTATRFWIKRNTCLICQI